MDANVPPLNPPMMPDDEDEDDEVTDGWLPRISVGMIKTSPAVLVTIITVSPAPTSGGDKLITGGSKPSSMLGSVVKSVNSGSVEVSIVSNGESVGVTDGWLDKKDSFSELKCSGLKIKLGCTLAAEDCWPARKESFKD
jgi:hypothetical protein